MCSRRMSTACPRDRLVPATEHRNMDPAGDQDHRPWSRRAQDISSVAWPSFLAGSAATMLFFAFIDPLVLKEATFPTWNIGRMTGYALGFFFFWGIAASSSALTLFLARTARPERPGRTDRS